MFLGTSNTSRLTILGNGNVGIGAFGTLQPTALFHTLGTLRFQNLTQNNTFSRILAQDIDGNVSWRDASTIGSGLSWNLQGNLGTNPVNDFVGTIDNKRLVFRTNNTEKLTILPNGNVGIGTNAPFVQLSNSTTHIGNNAGFGTTVASGLDWVNSNQGYVASFYNSDTADSERNGVLIKTRNIRSGSKALTVNSGAVVGGTDLFTVLGNGRVGIGTNTPTQLLTVSNGTTTGTYTTTGWVHSSDFRLKENISKILSPMNIIKNLNGVYYNWKNSSDKNRQVGFIAQEVQKILPEVVVGVEGDIEKGETLGMVYQNIVPVLVEAIKELNTKVEKQNNAVVENESLKSDIATLKSENETMKEKFALLEKSIAALCENGCGGLKNTNTSSDVDALYQSIPNPTDDIALINYFMTKEYTDATIIINTQEGKQIQAYKLESKLGAGSIKVSLGELSSGTYLYTLTVGGRVVDTKRLQIVK